MPSVQDINIIKLAANENPFGTSPLALKAIRENIGKIHLYPEYHPNSLKNKLANKYNLLPENIVVSCGSVEIIDIIIKAFVDFDEEILSFERSFIAYELLAKVHKRKHLFVKLTNFTCNINNLYSLITDKTKVLFIANPNNPTGTIIPHHDLYELLDKISSKILVVIDEAYFEYVTDKNYPNSISLQKEFPNLIILRTFSKIYGLAGLRVGYAIANDKIIKKLEKNKLPYSVNSLAACAAEAALDDNDFVEECIKINAIERKILYEKFKKCNYNVLPSQGNFIYLYFEDDNSKLKVLQQLKDGDMVICNLEIFGQDKSLRISIGDSEANRKIVKLLHL